MGIPGIPPLRNMQNNCSANVPMLRPPLCNTAPSWLPFKSFRHWARGRNPCIITDDDHRHQLHRPRDLFSWTFFLGGGLRLYRSMHACYVASELAIALGLSKTVAPVPPDRRLRSQAGGTAGARTGCRGSVMGDQRPVQAVKGVPLVKGLRAHDPVAADLVPASCGSRPRPCQCADSGVDAIRHCHPKHSPRRDAALHTGRLRRGESTWSHGIHCIRHVCSTGMSFKRASIWSCCILVCFIRT